ncbi:hypothetical protein SCP_1800630 [Sparassis crispa]|uniref:Uncharacterized protein n=1 Tax=Sparassis crispa TaxID=139825 RepID=A0A401H6M1_9APHY|nr:hypothetical protein SCP_1800630 [Sparassis crispa]GBE90041.1 hypothetical protein SCP_1800630 [Sparassis crispa]
MPPLSTSNTLVLLVLVVVIFLSPVSLIIFAVLPRRTKQRALRPHSPPGSPTLAPAGRPPPHSHYAR